MTKNQNNDILGITTEELLTELIRYNIPPDYCVEAAEQVMKYMEKNGGSLDDAMLFIIQWASRREYFDGLS